MVSPTPRSQYPFQSEVDSKYYFWLGTGLQGPFDDYNEAHASLVAAIEAAKADIALATTRYKLAKKDHEENKQ